MKNYRTVRALLFISAFGMDVAMAADYYVSTSGADTNPGTLSAPFKTIAKAYGLATAGTNIYVRGGIYPHSSKLVLDKSGTSASPIRVMNYPGETPIIDGSSASEIWTGIVQVSGNYNRFAGFEVRNAPDYGVLIVGTGNGNVLERLNVHDNGRIGSDGKGIGIYGSASNNLIINCDSHHNRSTVVGNADGFAQGSTGTGNVLRGNRAWRNSDDGFDMWNGAPTLLENNWSYENGLDDSLRRLGDGDGFKLGGNHSGKTSGGHTLRNNMAWRNPLNGFDENTAPLPITLYNNTAYMNGAALPDGESWARGYTFQLSGTVFKNNISVGTAESTPGDSSYNSWTLPVSASNADFVSTDDSANRGPRKADGSLPDSNFLALASSSDLIDKGVDIGLPYAGARPDLGAREFGGISAPTPTPVPTATPVAPTPTPTPSPTPVATPVPAQTNLVRNAGFESQGTGWTNWGSSVITSRSPNSGVYSLRTGSGEGGRGQIISGISGGQQFTIIASGRVSDQSSWCGIGVDFKSASGATLQSRSITISSNAWRDYRMDLTAPAGATQVQVYVWKDAGSNYCYADDFRLYRK